MYMLVENSRKNVFKTDSACDIESDDKVWCLNFKKIK